MSESSGELSNVVRQFMQYYNGKGQIHSAVEFAILETYITWLDKRIGKVPKEFKEMVNRIISLSVHEPAYHETVWQKASRILSEGITQKVEVIQQAKRKLPIATWGKKNE